MFLNRGKTTAPLAMRANVEHNHILHEHVVILSIETMPVPHVAAADRLVIDDLGYADDGITHVTARFGYMDDAQRPRRAARWPRPPGLECPLEVDEASYFLSTIELDVGDAPGHEPLAQAPVRRDLADHRRRRRVLRPAPRPHRDHGLADRG